MFETLLSNRKVYIFCRLRCSTSPIYITNLFKTRNLALVDKQPPPTHQAMKRGYSFPHIDAWGPLFMTRDWGHSNITDSEGQRFLGNQHKECGTMLQEQTLVISRPLCMSSSDPPGILRATKQWCDKSKSIASCKFDTISKACCLLTWE